MRLVQEFASFFASQCQECANYARISTVPESVYSFCAKIYTIFLHSAGSRSARFPGCLPPASRRAFAGPKCQYFIRKMYIFSIRYCKMSLLHKENVYFQHSGLQNVVLTYGMAKIGILQIAYIYRLHMYIQIAFIRSICCLYRLHIYIYYTAYMGCIYIYIAYIYRLHIWIAYIDCIYKLHI